MGIVWDWLAFQQYLFHQIHWDKCMIEINFSAICSLILFAKVHHRPSHILDGIHIQAAFYFPLLIQECAFLLQKQESPGLTARLHVFLYYFILSFFFSGAFFTNETNTQLKHATALNGFFFWVVYYGVLFCDSLTLFMAARCSDWVQHREILLDHILISA